MRDMALGLTMMLWVEGEEEEGERECVCVFLASGYRWVTVMHEIPISSAHPLTSLPYLRTW